MAATVGILVGGAIAFAGIPTVMNYQGRLLDEFGQPAQSGSYVIEFRVWGNETSTNEAECLWGREYPVYSAAGMFSILLGEGGQAVGSPTPVHAGIADAFEASQTCYMGMTIKTTPAGDVEAPTEVLPRQRIVTAPYAMMAGSAAALVAPDGTIKLEGTDTGVKATGDVSFNHPDGGTANLYVHDWPDEVSTLYVQNQGSEDADVSLRADGDVWLEPGTGKSVMINGKVSSLPLLHPGEADDFAHVAVFDEGNGASRLDVWNGPDADDDVRLISGGDIHFHNRGSAAMSMHATGISMYKDTHFGQATHFNETNYFHGNGFSHFHGGADFHAGAAFGAHAAFYSTAAFGGNVGFGGELKTHGTVKMLGANESKGIVYGNGGSKSFTASTDGFVTLHSHFATYTANIGSAAFGGSTDGSSVKNETFPVAKGEVFTLTRSDGNNTGYVYVHWRPMGYRPY